MKILKKGNTVNEAGIGFMIGLNGEFISKGIYE